MRDAIPPASRSDQAGAPAAVNRDELLEAVPDLLAGREWTRSAYAAFASVLSDPETAAMVRRFEGDVRAEMEGVIAALDRSGVRVGVPGGDPTDIEDEARAFVGRLVLPTLRGGYADARYLSVLVGFEAAGEAASGVASHVASRVGEAEWTEAVSRAQAASRERLEYLRGRIEDLAEVVFSGRPSSGYPASGEGRTETRPFR